MKRRTALGLTIGVLVFSGAAFAAENGGGTLQDRELQNLFEWSAQAVEATNPKMQAGGPLSRPADEVPPVLEYRGFDIR